MGRVAAAARGQGWCRLPLGLLLLLALPAHAEESLPEREAIEARLESLARAEGESLGAAQQREGEALEATLVALESLAEVEERLEALETRVEQAPAELMRLERELVAEEEAALALSATDLDDLEVDELEQRQQESVIELQDRKSVV